MKCIVQFFLDVWKGTAPGQPYVSLLGIDRIVLQWEPAIASPGSAPVAGYEVNFEFDLELPHVGRNW